MIEEFRVINSFPDFEISEFGRIRKKGESKLRCINVLSKHGDLIYNDIKIPKAVAEMWIPNPEGKEYVGYLDGDRFNCHYSNLYWCDLEDMYKFYPKLHEWRNNWDVWEKARQENTLPEDLMDFDRYELSWENYFRKLINGSRYLVYAPEYSKTFTNKIGNPERGYSFFNELVESKIRMIESREPGNRSSFLSPFTQPQRNPFTASPFNPFKGN